MIYESQLVETCLVCDWVIGPGSTHSTVVEVSLFSRTMADFLHLHRRRN